MMHAIAHRGRAGGTYRDEDVALGICRLPVVDLDAGTQPVTNENGRIKAVVDGTILEHQALRKDLDRRGHAFRSGRDDEVIPHLYEQWGNAFPEHLRGDFAIAIWDGVHRRLVLARDRSGVKPLYYARCGDLLVFASELKGILASELVRPELDYESIDAYLSFGFIPGPQTILSGVSKLQPGARLVADENGVHVDRYWHYPRPSLPSPRPTVEEYADGFLAELEASVQMRLGDLPVGLMLSGGLDSTVLLALAARNLAAPIRTFSVAFSEAGEANELARAKAMASTFGAIHHELELSISDAVQLDDLVWRLDEPLPELSALGMVALSELAGEHVSVALSGQGADGLLGGMPNHRNAKIAGYWDRVPRPARRAGERLLLHSPGRFSRLGRVLSASDPGARFLVSSTRLDEGLRTRLFRGPLCALDGEAPRRAVLSRLDGLIAHPMATFIYVDEQLAAVDSLLHYFDRSSTAGPLEVRVPFLDYRVVEYCAGVPTELKVRRLTRKYLLKRALRGIVPDEAIKGRKVGFFNAAIAEWLRVQISSSASDYLLGESPRYAAFLDPAEVRRLVAEHSKMRGSGHGGLLLAILMLEVWLTTFLPRARSMGVPSREQVSKAASS
jgi:asparagine synthase (glutamine-hydrolysing)